MLFNKIHYISGKDLKCYEKLKFEWENTPPILNTQIKINLVNLSAAYLQSLEM